MTQSADIKDRIQAALRDFPDSDDSRLAAENLLNAMGYESELVPDFEYEDAAEFVDEHPADNPDTRSERDFLANAVSANLVFQVTDDEIARSSSDQLDMFGSGGAFSDSNANSFMFAAVDLEGDSYPRGRYAAFSREINKRFQMPMCALFRTASNRITLAFARRRANLRDADRDVIGNISLIREIDPDNPHRAHLDILAELSLDERLRWMDARGRPPNFDGLLDAWLAALDTEELNKRFYKDLFGWFQTAVRTARFPDDKPEIAPEEHALRLITRMLFVWFVKEKGLVDGDLFIEERIAPLLDGYDRESGDSYYRAVLQNLFFATLNTEIGKREFSKGGQHRHRDFSKYRYRDLMAEPDALVGKFKRTPFINGGLFDCLDSFDARGSGGYRIDCFSDNPRHRRALSVPNRLFFGEGGLIPLFERYKFTVEENTPTETEVALDPELLGKAFENLLAANTPETSESARKQTGSYYTPRPVVDYMVDEALAAAISRKAAPTTAGNSDAADRADRERNFQDRLRRLFDYADPFEDDPFDPDESAAVVRAISQVKILDPAVGSGAFPMGVLHKLTLALRRLDHDNALWESVQRERAGERAKAAFDTNDQKARDDKLKKISETFERYQDSDYGRKLYLVQNSVFGVDIQPIATQIAKLRFFISLAIEQTPNENRDNYGIEPLPNLETRFVAANTLVGLEGQGVLPSIDAEKLRRAINDNREDYFHAKNRQAKRKCRDKDARLRQSLAAELTKIGFAQNQAQRIADWDPYDQNASSDWFDPQYMFGVSNGFDAVIGNPPYIQLQRDGGKLGRLYKDAGYQTFARTGDIYYLFYEKGVKLAKRDTGHLCLITSNQWMRGDSGLALRKFIESRNPVQLVNLGAGFFDSVTVNTCVLMVNNSANQDMLLAADVRESAQSFPPIEFATMRPENGETWAILSEPEKRVKEKMETVGTPLEDWGVNMNYGVKTGYNVAFIIDDATKQSLVLESANSAEIIKPVLRGRDIQRYRAKQAGLWIIDTHNGYGDVPAVNIGEYPAVKSHLDGFYPALQRRSDKGETPYNLRNCAYHDEFAEERIVWGNLANQAKFAYAPKGMFISSPANMMTPYSPYLLAVLNSKLVDWYFRLIGVERDGGYYEYMQRVIQRIPIPKISADAQSPFIELAERILSAKGAEPPADTSALESELDALVHALYGLSAEEAAAASGV